MIKVLDSFLRLPRLEVDLYIKLACSGEKDFENLIKSYEYKDFLNILHNHSPYLEKLIDQNNLKKKHKVTILNYLMRCTTRFAPYKDMSAITKIELSDITNFLNNQEIKTKVTKRESRREKYLFIENPLIKQLNDFTFIKFENSVKSIKSPHINKLIEIKKNNLSQITKPTKIDRELIKNNIILKIREFDFFNEPTNRTSFNLELKNKEVSKNYLEDLSTQLSKLVRAFDGNEINKSIYWIEKIRKDLFLKNGPTPQKLIDVTFTNEIFNDESILLSDEAQNKITPIRMYLSNLILESKSRKESVLELTDIHIKEICNLKNSRETDLDKEYCVIGTFLNKNDFLLNYCRSSYKGTRPIADQVEIDDHDEPLDYLLVDIICTASEKEVLQKRPKTTNYYITLDQDLKDSDMTKIYLEDLFIYPSHTDIVLFSKSLNKRLIPIITTSYLAERDTNSLYRFFAAMAKNHFNKGIHLDLSWNNLNFIPRIKYKNIVLYPKTWRFNKKDLNIIKKDLPEICRMVDGDKNGIVIKRSDYFEEQINKFKSDIITINEDLYLESAIKLESGKKHLYEIAYRFTLGERKKSLPFKVYNDRDINQSSEVIELNIHTPKPFIDAILEYLIRKYFQNTQFYFINYQIPESHIRVRLNKLNEDIFNKIISDKKLKDFGTTKAIKIPYKYELSTYNQEEGVKLYIKASQILSSKYIRIKNITNSKNTVCLPGIGPIYEIIYMTFLAEKLLKDSFNLKSVVNYKNKTSHTYEKRIFEIINKNTELIKRLNELASETSKELIAPIINWKKLAQKTNFIRDELFFEHRLIHMEIFRLTDGSHNDTNTIILMLVKRIRNKARYK